MTYQPKVMGKVYAHLRKSRGVTQAWLATQLGLDTSAISRIETGRSSPKVPQHLAICKALKARPELPFYEYYDQVDALPKKGKKP